MDIDKKKFEKGDAEVRRPYKPSDSDQLVPPWRIFLNIGLVAIALLYLAYVFDVDVFGSRNQEAIVSSEGYPGSVGPVLWLEGGTLHTATLGERRAAPYQDRLPTSADFYRSASGSLPTREIVEAFEHQISVVASSPELADQSVAGTSAAVFVLMERGL